MRISDWSSDVCSSDLAEGVDGAHQSPDFLRHDDVGVVATRAGRQRIAQIVCRIALRTFCSHSKPKAAAQLLAQPVRMLDALTLHQPSQQGPDFDDADVRDRQTAGPRLGVVFQPGAVLVTLLIYTPTGPSHP